VTIARQRYSSTLKRGVDVDVDLVGRGCRGCFSSAGLAGFSLAATISREYESRIEVG
jgi:hypothetical protein